jgi:hypothetical protein
VIVDTILARDKELRTHATARPWHQAGEGIRLRLLGPLPQATVVVDPYAPNPQDAPLLLHRVNTYEDLELEIERLRATLRDLRAELDSANDTSSDLPVEELYRSLADDLKARIGAALGERRAVVDLTPAARNRRALDG